MTDKITHGELIEIFGDAMPIEAITLLRTIGEASVAEVRAKLREMAAAEVKPATMSLDEAERHELTCLRARVLQLAYPCSPHCDGYLREQALRNSMAWTRTASAQVADLHTANNQYLERARAADARIADLDLALTLALYMLGAMEPGDSRAVSDEYVAMAVLAADQPDKAESRAIIRTALDRLAP